MSKIFLWITLYSFLFIVACAGKGNDPSQTSASNGDIGEGSTVTESNDSSPGNDFPLASPSDPPPGNKAIPGESSNVYLGRYKTCKGYFDLLKSRMSIVQKAFIPIAGMLQDTSTVECVNDHTCNCDKNQYFTDDTGGKKIPLYRCIETSSAGVESNEVYQPNAQFSENGVIKIALPRSYCNKVQK